MTLREKFHKAAVCSRKLAFGLMMIPVTVFSYGIARSSLAQYNQHQPHSVSQYTRWGMTEADAGKKVVQMNQNNDFWGKIGATGDDIADRWVWPAAGGLLAFTVTAGLAAATRPKRQKQAELIIRL